MRRRGLIKRKRDNKTSKSGLPERKTQNFLGGRSDEIVHAVLEILFVEVQATKTYDR